MPEVTGAAAFVDEFVCKLKRSNFDPLLIFCLDDALSKTYMYANSDTLKILYCGLRQELERTALQEMPFYQLYSLARIFYNLGYYMDCQNVCRTLLRRFGSDERPFHYLASCFEAQGDLKLSRHFYRKALRLNDCEDNRIGMTRVSAKLKQSPVRPNAQYAE
jgi:hypothetical protein